MEGLGVHSGLFSILAIDDGPSDVGGSNQIDLLD